MLQEYKRKRDFKITPEPSGAEEPKGKRNAKVSSLTFVIQKHAARRLHYDFRLEVDGVMVSWAVPKGPSLNPAEKRLAVMTEDHPMEYSSFEGIIPEKQYGAGEVIIWDHGTYSPDEDDDYSWEDKAEANKRMRAALTKGKLTFYLKGDKLEGSWTLVKLHNKDKEWLLIKRHDKFQDTERDITESDASVVSGKTLEDLQENGADRIWTAKGAQPADRQTTGKSSKKQATDVTVNQAKKKELKKELPDRVLKGAKSAAFPKSIAPMLATLVDEPFSADGWFFEPKLDGIRAISYVKNGSVKLTSRRGLDLTEKYPAICGSLSQTGQFVFDGEIVALDENGKPSFQHLQQSGGGLRSFASRKNSDFKAHLLYYVFDILYAQGKDLTGLPVIQRKKILESVLNTSENVRLVQSLGSDGEAVFQACVENGLEGIVGKKADSTYDIGSRSRSWLKVKTATTSEFLICGYTEGTGSRKKTFGSLILGEYDDQGILQFVGGVGTGLNDKKLDSLLSQMTPLTTKQCPFKKRPTGKLNPIWVKPQLVVEVKYMERTQDNMLRAPVFLHLREDIEPKKVKAGPIVHVHSNEGGKLELANEQKHSARKKHPTINNSEAVNSVLDQLKSDKEKLTLDVEGNSLPVSSLNKVYWPAFGKEPAITKRDYLSYLAQVSEFQIPHLSDRLLTLVRFPNGINQGRFYQKHWEHKLPSFVKSAQVFTEHENRDQEFLVCNNMATLLWLGQIADLEIHTSHTRITSEPDARDLPSKMTGSLKALEASIANYPDFIVLDMDPYLYSGLEKQGAEPELHRKGFEKCRAAALYLKEHLDHLNLNSFIKTSGKTGLHIYIPIERNIDYDTVRRISEIICAQVLKEHPDEVTMDWAVKKRTGKVFLDHNMNARSKSLASIYSPRVAAEGTVSTPIEWNELEKIYPTDFTMWTVPNRLSLKGDLWMDILEHKCNLKTSFDPEKTADLREHKARARGSAAARRRSTH